LLAGTKLHAAAAATTIAAATTNPAMVQRVEEVM
jgi:hypothetical protein